MTLEELMNGKTATTKKEYVITNDDWVLAINPDPDAVSPTDVKDYVVVQMGVEGLDAQLNPVTQDKQYIRSGLTTTKTGTQRTFSVSGDRYVGDAAQDFMLSHDMKYGTGDAVRTDYVYFNILNFEGEKGEVSVIVNSDGAGSAGENAGIDIELRKIGAQPVEYAWTPIP